MAAPVETIWETLAARFEGIEGFRTVSRRRREYGIEEMPALLVLDDDGDEVLASEPDDPLPSWRLSGELIVLARSTPETERSGGSLNELVQAVREALERKASDSAGYDPGSFYWDLGGLGSVSITKVEKGSGEQSGQSVARMYVEIVTNPA